MRIRYRTSAAQMFVQHGSAGFDVWWRMAVRLDLFTGEIKASKREQRQVKESI